MSLYRFSSIRRCGLGLSSTASHALPAFGTVLSRFYAGGGGLSQDAVKERVLHILQSFSKIDQSKLKTESHFMKDLGLDSLDVVEIVMAFEEEFTIEIPDDHADKIHTAKDAIEYISHHPNAS